MNSWAETRVMWERKQETEHAPDSCDDEYGADKHDDDDNNTCYDDHRHVIESGSLWCWRRVDNLRCWTNRSHNGANVNRVQLYLIGGVHVYLQQQSVRTFSTPLRPSFSSLFEAITIRLYSVSKSRSKIKQQQNTFEDNRKISETQVTHH